MIEIRCQTPPESAPTFLAIAAENAIADIFGDSAAASSKMDLQLPKAAWRKLLRQIEQLDAQHAETLAVLEEPLAVLEPTPTEAGVLNLTLDGKRDEYIGVANLAAAIAAFNDMRARKRLPLDTDQAERLFDLLEQANTAGMRVWIWQNTD